jgi:hypothetical protein
LPPCWTRAWPGAPPSPAQPARHRNDRLAIRCWPPPCSRRSARGVDGGRDRHLTQERGGDMPAEPLHGAHHEFLFISPAQPGSLAGVMSFSLAGRSTDPEGYEAGRGHHRIVVIRRTGTTRDGMGSRRHPTSTDERWPTGCYRSSPASVAASPWLSARAGLARADLAGPAHPVHPPADEPARRRASGVHRRDLPPRLQQLPPAGELAEVRSSRSAGNLGRPLPTPAGRVRTASP